MKTLTPVKKTFLLEAPLEILHEESMEWLNEVEFWKDESAFFYTLIMQKIKKSSRALKTKDGISIENHLIYISSEKLDDLKSEVQKHERFLAKILNDVTQDEQSYRLKHKRIATKMYDFEKEFKDMKRKIFQVVEKENSGNKILIN